MDISQDFQPGQIVALAHQDRSLYAQVIQVVVSRQLCWVRPLFLVTLTAESPLVTDLQDASDLLWPGQAFRPALDTEVLTLWSQILAKELKPEPDLAVKQQLHHFLQQAWQTDQQGIGHG